MFLWECIRIAFTQMWSHKLRSLLTTLGVIIAVTSVITVVSIIDGFSLRVMTFMEEMGTNTIHLYPRYTRSSRQKHAGRVGFGYEDAAQLVRLGAEIEAAVPVYNDSSQIRFRETVKPCSLLATVPAFQEVRNWYAAEGRFFSEEENATARNVCVIGQKVVQELELGSGALGVVVEIEKRPFRVIGVLDQKGGLFGIDLDGTVIIPFETGLQLNMSRRGYRPWWWSIEARAADTDRMQEALYEVTAIMRNLHQLSPDEEDDFYLFTAKSLLEEFEQISNYATFALVGLVSISLLVGGIGIMNIMLVSVGERTREIGLRKAVGARDYEIFIQFLVEAGVLGFAGGTIGIAGGLAIGQSANAVLPFLTPAVPLWAILLSFGFSSGTGLVFGVFPAAKAARLHPIIALRHE